MSAASPADVYLDISDLVEFYSREESSSGVQRVLENVAPYLLERGSTPLVFDRSRGLLVPFEIGAAMELLSPTTPRDERGHLARALLDEVRHMAPVRADENMTVLFPGAVWINDALMLAVWTLARQGARCVYLLYDLTPVFETGHTAAVNQLFERYLWLIARTGYRIPAISRSSRLDFESWCERNAVTAPGGSATGLPNGIAPAEAPALLWPRPYVLFVGTVESRKNHAFALRVWERLIATHGPDAMPDLVCVGRLGWHAEEFLTAYVNTRGLSGRLHVLSDSVTDADLASLYTHALFTIYPSRYEGWGLPVSESLAFGKVCIAADNSSLREAGGEGATYVPTDDLDAWLAAIETWGLDPAGRSDQEQGIRMSPAPPITWNDVAATLHNEVTRVREAPLMESPTARPELGREYMLSAPPPAPDGTHADVYLQHLVTQGTTPMLRQPRGAEDFRVTDLMVSGQFGAPQSWGLEIHAQRPITLTFTRPTSGPLVLLVATRSMPGRVMVSIISGGGDVHSEVYLGAILRIDLGDGSEGEVAQARLTVVDARDSVEGFLGLVSLVVLEATNQEAQVVALEAQARALRQELDFLTNTRSWRLTAPLRTRWGRSSPR
jgi:glycosyltransferase involved in cell wall biosynthesis